MHNTRMGSIFARVPCQGVPTQVAVGTKAYKPETVDVRFAPEVV